MGVRRSVEQLVGGGVRRPCKSGPSPMESDKHMRPSGRFTVPSQCGARCGVCDFRQMFPSPANIINVNLYVSVLRIQNKRLFKTNSIQIFPMITPTINTTPSLLDRGTCPPQVHAPHRRTPRPPPPPDEANRQTPVHLKQTGKGWSDYPKWKDFGGFWGGLGSYPPPPGVRRFRVAGRLERWVYE